MLEKEKRECRNKIEKVAARLKSLEGTYPDVDAVFKALWLSADVHRLTEAKKWLDILRKQSEKPICRV